MLAACADVADVIAQLRCIAPRSRQAQQQFGKADDGIQGCSELMAHGGEEPGAGTRREFRGAARFVECCTMRRWVCSTVSSSSFAMVPMPRNRPRLVTQEARLNRLRIAWR